MDYYKVLTHKGDSFFIGGKTFKQVANKAHRKFFHLSEYDFEGKYADDWIVRLTFVDDPAELPRACRRWWKPPSKTGGDRVGRAPQAGSIPAPPLQKEKEMAFCCIAGGPERRTNFKTRI